MADEEDDAQGPAEAAEQSDEREAWRRWAREARERLPEEKKAAFRKRREEEHRAYARRLLDLLRWSLLRKRD